MSFGVDYYPEQWPENRWAEDARLMRKAGLSVVRLAEFAWARMEPSPGEYDFDWLERAIAVLADHDLQSVLGTPSAAPPAWMVEKHPDILPVRADGQRLSFGGRHHDCQSNTTYRKYVGGIVRAMARRFAGNPHVIGWQTDNELGNSHNDLCVCDSCTAAFQRWLEERYGTIEALNQAWGTVFWSQTYDHFGQIPAPRPTPNSHNPSLLLAWRRFASNLIVDFQKTQLDILREECPDHIVTHNMMGFFDKSDYFRLGEDLDFVSHDQYPLGFRPGWLDHDPAELAMPLDLMRGIKKKPFWIMEHQSGPSGWEMVGPTPRPGQLRLWTTQSVAHGADTVVYFRWRTCLFGTEEYWHGVLPHSGRPGRRYEEITRTVADLQPVMEACQGSGAGAEVALLYSWDQRWALQIQPHHPDLDYRSHIAGYYRELFDRNVPVDFVSLEQDLNPYRLVIPPLLFLMTPEIAGTLVDYVESGGHLVLTMRTGVKDWDNAVNPDDPPGLLADLVGIRVEDYDCLRLGGQPIRWLGSEERGQGSKWADVITLAGATALATYEADYYEGTPAVTRNVRGQGRVYYVATELDCPLMKKLMTHTLAEAGVSGLLDTPPGVEATRRQGEDREWLFLLNHNAEAATVSMPAGWATALGADLVSDRSIVLPAYGIAVLARERHRRRRPTNQGESHDR